MSDRKPFLEMPNIHVLAQSLMHNKCEAAFRRIADAMECEPENLDDLVEAVCICVEGSMAKDARIAELEAELKEIKTGAGCAGNAMLSPSERLSYRTRITALERDRDEALARAEKAEAENNAALSVLAAVMPEYPGEGLCFLAGVAHTLIGTELADRKKYDLDVREVAEYRKGSGAADRLLAAPYWKGGE